MVARLAIGAGIALIGHILVVTLAFGIGVLVGHWFLALVIAEFVLLVASLVTAITLTIRARHGLGLGVVFGWLAGTAGLMLVIVAVVVACVIAVLALVSLMLVSILIF
jgi:hypothetical protein